MTFHPLVSYNGDGSLAQTRMPDNGRVVDTYYTYDGIGRLIETATYQNDALVSRDKYTNVGIGTITMVGAMIGIPSFGEFSLIPAV